MECPVLIIGGGPAGSATAMFLKMQGIGLTIVERMEFPRYHIGESMTGECGDRVRDVPVASRDKDWKIYPRPTWQVLRSEFDKRMLETALSRGTEFVALSSRACQHLGSRRSTRRHRHYWRPRPGIGRRHRLVAGFWRTTQPELRRVDYF
jgi:flavin-dependent dehydrogenase